MTDSPTLEQLQAEVLQLRQDKEALLAKSKADDTKIAEVEESLKQAREINGKLITQMPVSTEHNNPEPEPEPHKETVDEFCDSFIKSSVKQLKNIYGSDNVANFD